MSKLMTRLPTERIESAILFIRGEKVILDRDLAMLYGVETRVLNQAVTRNHERFPDDFMFELTREEILGISQFKVVFDAIRQLMSPPQSKRKPIGFRPKALKK
jgi:hypothetical protein